MSKKILALFISVIMFLSMSSVSFAANDNETAISQDEEVLIFEIASQSGFNLEDIADDIKGSDALSYEFRGVAKIDNQEITFGVFNGIGLSNEQFLAQIDEELKGFIKHYAEVESVSDIQFNQVKSSVKTKIFSFQDKKSKIEKIEDKFAAKKTKATDITTKKISKAEQNKLKSELIKKREQQIENNSVEIDASNEVIPNNQTRKELDQYKKDAQEIIKQKEKGILKDDKKSNSTTNGTENLMAVASAAGGPAFYDNPSDPSAANPYMGDRQDRLKQKRRFNGTDGVYSWIPTWVGAFTTSINDSTKERQVYAQFKWDTASLANLVIDNNEAVEAEVLFYNYGSNVGIPGNGLAWMDSHPPKAWSTNLPSGYLDTRYLDDGTEKSYAVGTRYPQNLQAGTLYQFVMNAYPSSSQSGAGLWQINFQRGYYHDSTNLLYRVIRGSGDEWYIFNEEYETTAKIKQYHKYNSRYYAPSNFNENSATNYETQFRYKDGFTSYTGSFSNIATGSIPSGGYKVYRLQVNSDNQYKINTAQNGSSYDTWLELYDHDFTMIKFNDDANGTLYSQIDRYLPKGDYYIVVRGFSWSAVSCSVSATIQSSIGNPPIYVGDTKYIDIPQNGSQSYSFSASSTTTRTFKTGYWQTSADTYLYLYNSSGTLLTSNDDSNGTLYSTISYNVTNGQTYVIQVKGYNNSAVKCTLIVQ